MTRAYKGLPLQSGAVIDVGTGPCTIDVTDERIQFNLVEPTTLVPRPLIRIEQAIAALPLLGKLYSVVREIPDDVNSPLISWQLPTTTSVTNFRQQHLEELGANTWKFAYRKAGSNGEFTIDQQVAAVRTKKKGKPAPEFSVSLDPKLLVHDLRDHALGQAAQPAYTMDVTANLVEDVLELAKTEPHVARKIMVNIFENLDNHTDLLFAFAVLGHWPRDRYVLSNLVQASTKTAGMFRLHYPEVVARTKKLLKEREIKITDGMVQWERENLVEYTRSVWQALGDLSIAA